MKYPIVRLVLSPDNRKYPFEEWLSLDETKRFFRFLEVLPELKDWTKLRDVAKRLNISMYFALRLTQYLILVRKVITQTKKKKTVTKGPLLYIRREAEHPTSPVLLAPYFIKKRPHLSLKTLLKIKADS